MRGDAAAHPARLEQERGLQGRPEDATDSGPNGSGRTEIVFILLVEE